MVLVEIGEITSKNLKMKSNEQSFEFYVFDDLFVAMKFNRRRITFEKEEIIEALLDFKEELVARYINPFNSIRKSLLGEVIKQVSKCITELSKC